MPPSSSSARGTSAEHIDRSRLLPPSASTPSLNAAEDGTTVRGGPGAAAACGCALTGKSLAYPCCEAQAGGSAATRIAAARAAAAGHATPGAAAAGPSLKAPAAPPTPQHQPPPPPPLTARSAQQLPRGGAATSDGPSCGTIQYAGTPHVSCGGGIDGATAGNGHAVAPAHVAYTGAATSLGMAPTPLPAAKVHSSLVRGSSMAFGGAGTGSFAQGGDEERGGGGGGGDGGGGGNHNDDHGGSGGGGGGGGGGAADDVIVIHVCDDNRRINRDFYCSRELLLTHMTYFTPYLADERRSEEIDISVHCDVHIFEWLMEYIHQPFKPPTLDAGSVISVLISADFLQMRPLSDHCVRYLRGALPEVLRLPIDLSCVSDALLAQLATLLDAEDIERLRDKKDKIASRLYAKKLEALLAVDANALHRCAFCTRLFTAAQREWEPCPRAPQMLDFHGNPIAEHVPNRAWDVHRWVASLRRSKGGAREAYWRLWGLTNFLTCSTCEQPFPVCELDGCAYHPHEPVFERGDHRGSYPCCQQPALRFDVAAGRRKGCLTRRHTPVTKPPYGCTSAAMDSAARAAAKLMDTALAHADVVLGSGDSDGAAGWASAKEQLAATKSAAVAAAAAAAAATASASQPEGDEDLFDEELLRALDGLNVERTPGGSRRDKRDKVGGGAAPAAGSAAVSHGGGARSRLGSAVGRRPTMRRAVRDAMGAARASGEVGSERSRRTQAAADAADSDDVGSKSDSDFYSDSDVSVRARALPMRARALARCLRRSHTPPSEASRGCRMHLAPGPPATDPPSQSQRPETRAAHRRGGGATLRGASSPPPCHVLPTGLLTCRVCAACVPRACRVRAAHRTRRTRTRTPTPLPTATAAAPTPPRRSVAAEVVAAAASSKTSAGGSWSRCCAKTTTQWAA